MECDVMIARAVYTAMMYASMPVALTRLLWRSRNEPGYRRHWGERFGRHPSMRFSESPIWVHAVSVGETRAAAPVIAEIERRHPGVPILLTHMTPTGRATGAALFGDRVTQTYLPYDLPGATAKFLAHYRPRLGLIMETEIWPNLTSACRRERIPLYLVNARLSEKSYQGYTRVGSIVRAALGDLSGVAAQSIDDAERLLALGAPQPTVTGNVKFDVAIPDEQLTQGLRWRSDWGTRPVVLAASTRDGEEALLIDAARPLFEAGVLLVIVPRHPRRFDEVASLLDARGVQFVRRSSTAAVEPACNVMLGDSMGEMFAYYAACDVAFIGGSLLPFGSQNLIEASAVGKPVIVGPHTFNFEEASRHAIEAGAAFRVGNAAELVGCALRLIADDDARNQASIAARRFVSLHQGATKRTLDSIGL